MLGTGVKFTVGLGVTFGHRLDTSNGELPSQVQAQTRSNSEQGLDTILSVSIYSNTISGINGHSVLPLKSVL